MIAAIGGVVLVALRRRAPRVLRLVVTGESMRPTLERGDRVLALAAAGPVRPGQVVVLADPEHPEDPSRSVIKRVEAVDGDRVVVVGDQRTLSTDSRRYGPVAQASVRGRVIWRYHPAERVGPIR